MARWITVRQPFDFHWPSRAVTAFMAADLGDHFVKDELADFAIACGYATEGKVDETTRSTKGKKGSRAAKATDNRSDDAMAQPGVAMPPRSADRQPVDPDAE